MKFFNVRAIAAPSLLSAAVGLTFFACDTPMETDSIIDEAPLALDGSEPDRLFTAAEEPPERPQALAGEAADEPQESAEEFDLENKPRPSSAASCDTDCNNHCWRQHCVTDPFGNEHCTPGYVSPPCKATCEVEKKAACTKLVEHCTDKWTQKKSVEDRFDRVVWAEVGSDEYIKLAAAVAAAAATAGAASGAVFSAFYDALGNLIVEVAQQVGEEVAAQYFYDALNHGTFVAENITVGRQVWKREECSPSCDNPWVGCLPLPASNAFYVGWDH